MYKIRIFTTTGRCREFNVKDYDYAIERIESYKNNYKLYSFHTLSYFDGACWVELV